MVTWVDGQLVNKPYCILSTTSIDTEIVISLYYNGENLVVVWLLGGLLGVGNVVSGSATVTTV